MPRSRFIFSILYFTFFIFTSCSVQKQISQSAKEDVLSAPVLQTAHVGISIYEPATNKYWFNYQGDHYFVPASNTKLPTCYAAMKYLGDSLVGLKYAYAEEKINGNNLLIIQPTGDPSFFHEDFKRNPVFDFITNQSNLYKYPIAIFDTIFKDQRWGSGWSWNDYEEDYMAERNVFPIYGNIIKIHLVDSSKRDDVKWKDDGYYRMFETQNPRFDALANYNYWYLPENVRKAAAPRISISRNLVSNDFRPKEGQNVFSDASLSLVTQGYDLTRKVLEDTIKARIGDVFKRKDGLTYVHDCPKCKEEPVHVSTFNSIHSQPTDSLLKPMMHESDNFFAEQSLLMVSNQLLGIMSDAKIIDTLLKTDFKDLPQKPRWADGSGLSRFNLFTPQDFVVILNKMKNEFGMERIKVILPTGGEGTIESRFKAESGYIFAKTGTLSGVVALSGFLYTKKGRLLIFSTLVNNHNGSATDVRNAMEKFLQGIRNKY